jgi:hypothetical protein
LTSPRVEFNLRAILYVQESRGETMSDDTRKDQEKEGRINREGFGKGIRRTRSSR